MRSAWLMFALTVAIVLALAWAASALPDDAEQRVQHENDWQVLCAGVAALGCAAALVVVLARSRIGGIR